MTGLDQSTGSLWADGPRPRGAKKAWETPSPSCRREYAQWIAEAKRPETRDARVAKAIPRIASRERLKG